MVISISKCKDDAVESLTGKWGKSAIATLICIFIYGLFGEGVNYALSPIHFQLGSVLQIFFLPLAWGYSIVFLKSSRGEEIDYGTMFEGFNDYLRIFLTELLKGIYIILWSLLLIIPGIIKAYSYAMTDYILKDQPDMKYDAAIEESMFMMEGHKMELFLLDLSMIGWAILSILSLGIGLLFLYPYNNSAHAFFYKELKLSEQENVAE